VKVSPLCLAPARRLPSPAATVKSLLCPKTASHLATGSCENSPAAWDTAPEATRFGVQLGRQGLLRP